MKLLLILSSVFLLTVSAEQCNGKKKTGAGVYKAKLETKGLCMNYTLRLLEGDIDFSTIDASWTDESTGKTHTNVFGLANPCDFPTTIEQGDDFYFTVESPAKQDCAVCMAFYPTPPKKLFIKVVQK